MTAPEPAIGFGTLRLDRAQRQLFDGDLPVRLGGRAMDLLIALVDRAPGVVSKAELEALVWPRSVVEESSLRVQVGALRKVLGDGVGGARYIANVPGRGYAFVAALQRLAAPAAPLLPAEPAVTRLQLPVRLTTMVGRARNLEAVATLLATQRLVSIIGAGGVGKTTLAIAAAETVAAQQGIAVGFVDLSLVAEPERVAAVVAAALAITLPAQAGAEAIAAQLQGRQDLLLLDNCEHVVNAVAVLAARLLQAAPGLRILATSHEALMVAGEHVHRLDPLPVPPAGLAVDAATALQYPAVALLAERAAADAVDFELGDAEAPLAAELCRRLDGLPLAIEMAAARIGIFGLRDLVSRLDERLGFLSGDRTTQARHQTLQALHAWSYKHLPDGEQALLRRLSVFAGPFSIAAAHSVAPDAACVLDGIVDLVGRSLLVPDFNGDTARYRLLMTTRHFARGQLAGSVERHEVQARHVAWVTGQLEAANREWLGPNRVAWTAAHAPLFDEVLQALDWALSPDGDTVQAAELTLAAMHLSHQLSAHERFQRYLGDIVERFPPLAAAQPLLEMRLCVALAVARALSGAPVAQIEPVYRRGVAAAQRLGDGLHHAETPYGMFVAALMNGDSPQALVMAQRIEAVSVAHGDSAGTLIARRMLVQALHLGGRHEEARVLSLQVLQEDRRFTRLGGYWIDPVDRQVSIRLVLARVLWIQGRAERALATVREALALGALDVHTAQVQVLATAAIPIACWTGDLAWARELTTQLAQITARHGLGFWARWARAFEQVLAGEPAPVSRPADHWLADLLCTLSPQAVDTEALQRVEQGSIGWCGPEVLRAWGQRLLNAGAGDEARRCHEQALLLARRQGALAWELRAATSLAQLLQAQGQLRAAQDTLAPVLARFSEGGHTADLVAAAELLDALSLDRRPAAPARRAGRPSRSLR